MNRTNAELKPKIEALSSSERNLIAFLEGKTRKTIDNSLRFGEIPRRIKLDGKIWTWRHYWTRTLEEEVELLQKQGYMTKVVLCKGRKLIYFCNGSEVK